MIDLMLHTHIIFLLSYSVTTFGLRRRKLGFICILYKYPYKHFVCIVCVHVYSYIWNRAEWTTKAMCFGLGHGNCLDQQLCCAMIPCALSSYRCSQWLRLLFISLGGFVQLRSHTNCTYHTSIHIRKALSVQSKCAAIMS